MRPPAPDLPARMVLRLLAFSAMTGMAVTAADKPLPTEADVAYGAHPHQLMDIYLPPGGGEARPVLIWFGGLWEPAKHVPDVNRFFPAGIALVGVELRTMKDAVADKATPPISYVMNDAARAVQFVRMNAARWNLDPRRIAVGGGSHTVHSPAWAVGFQKLAEKAGATVYVKFPDHPTDKYKDIWDFIAQQLHQQER